MSFQDFKSNFYSLFPLQATCNDLGSSFHADFHNYKNGRLDGIQIIFENGVFEVSEGQAGKNQNELHVFRNYKSIGNAINFVVKLNEGKQKPKPIKIWN